MIIKINVEKIAEEMKNRGITKVSDGWTNTLMDILEDLYNIETKVSSLMTLSQD